LLPDVSLRRGLLAGGQQLGHLGFRETNQRNVKVVLLERAHFLRQQLQVPPGIERQLIVAMM